MEVNLSAPLQPSANGCIQQHYHYTHYMEPGEQRVLSHRVSQIVRANKTQMCGREGKQSQMKAANKHSVIFSVVSCVWRRLQRISSFIRCL